MSKEKVLVTGGAGLIGSHLVDLLLREGYAVRILDNLCKPTHEGMPGYLPKEAEFIRGDMSNPGDVAKALRGVRGVFHQAAEGGFNAGIVPYIKSNTYGTALMMEQIAKGKTSVERVVVASSVAVYGEAQYRCGKHGAVHPPLRSDARLRQGLWEQTCPICSEELQGDRTPESKPVHPAKIYSITKYDEERIVLSVGEDIGIHASALRYFLTYGPRQSLRNPYTGICSIFSSQLANGVRPHVFEDGNQTRDFVFVKDVADANLLVYRHPDANARPFNVGTGLSARVMDLYKTLSGLLGKKIEPVVEGEYRLGETRHLSADISAIAALGFSPKTSLAEGLKAYLDWFLKEGDVTDYFSKAHAQLQRTGVIRRAQRQGAAS